MQTEIKLPLIKVVKALLVFAARGDVRYYLNGMRVATKGERLHAMRRMEAWATERVIVLLNPRGSEYRQLIEQQDC